MRSGTRLRTAGTIAIEGVTDDHEGTMTVDPEGRTAKDSIEIDNPVDPEGRLADTATATGDRSAMETATFVSMLHMVGSEDLLAQADRAVGRDA